MGIKLMASLHCKPDAEHTLEQELKKLAEVALHEPGCLSYKLYAAGPRCRYVIMEEWQDEEVLKKHRDSPYYKHFLRIAPVLIEKPVEPVQLTRLV